MAFIAVRQIYTADPGNLFASKKAFTSADAFAIVIFAETDVPPGTAFNAHFQVVNPRVQADNWFRPRSIAHSLFGGSHSHSVTVFGGGSGFASPTSHSHVGSIAVPVHGATSDFVFTHAIPGPSLIVWVSVGSYSGIIQGLQGSETLNGFFFVRGLVSVGSGDLFDDSGEAWYRVTP